MWKREAAKALLFLSLGIAFFSVQSAQGCTTCGLNKSFSPKMLLISMGFVVMPALFAAVIAWRIYKDREKS